MRVVAEHQASSRLPNEERKKADEQSDPNREIQAVVESDPSGAIQTVVESDPRESDPSESDPSGAIQIVVKSGPSEAIQAVIQREGLIVAGPWRLRGPNSSWPDA